MVENLKHTGTPFDYHVDDKNYINDLLNADIGENLSNKPPTTSDETFEEED